MKKFFISAVAVLMALGASAATTITVADYAATSFITTDNHFSITTAKESSTNAPAYNSTGQDLRVYANGTLTIEAGSEMTSIVLTLSAQGQKRLSAENTVDCGTLQSDDAISTVTWTGNSKKVVITVGAKATLGTDGADKAGQLDFTALTIEGGTEGTVEGAPLYAINFKEDQTGWTINNVTIHDSLTYVWAADEKYGYKASAFKGANYPTESWLISPAIDLTGSNPEHAKLIFSHARKFGELSQLSVKISVDGQTWDNVTVPNWPDGSSWAFIESGEIDITKYIGANTQIAFVYTSDENNAATWEVENLQIYAGEVENYESIANTPETAYTTTEAIALIDADKNLHETVYVKGKISELKEWTDKQDQYHNVNFYITDGTNEFYVYGCFGLDKAPFNSAEEYTNLLHVGDNVIIAGTLTKYNNTYEFNQGCYVYSVKAETGIDNTTIENATIEKFVRNGVVIIRRNGVEYNAVGAVVK